MENLISLSPLLGRVVYQNDRMEVRKMNVLNNYSIYYEVLLDKINILFFWDNRQDPKNLNL